MSGKRLINTLFSCKETNVDTSTDDVLLKLAKNLYKDGHIKIERKVENENEVLIASVPVWYYEDVKSNKPTQPEKTKESPRPYNDYIEDEKNPNSIISKLNELFDS